MTASCFTLYLNEKILLLCETKSRARHSCKHAIQSLRSNARGIKGLSFHSAVLAPALPEAAFPHDGCLQHWATCPKFISSRKIKTRVTSPSMKKDLSLQFDSASLRSVPNPWTAAVSGGVPGTDHQGEVEVNHSVHYKRKILLCRESPRPAS